MKADNKITIAISTFFVGLLFGFAIREIPLEAKLSQTAPISFSDNQYKFPKSVIPIQRSCYSLDYDCRTRNASWVYERITSESLSGTVDRKNSSFKEDPAIPEPFRSTLSDFKGSGFDRGHLAPAADHTSTQEGMSETFYLSNMSPQNAQFNRGYWASLEKHVRDLTKTYAVVEVFTGPLYLPEEDQDGTKWVRYQVIGKNDVAVPTHFFKVLVLENSSGNKDYRAFILPNEPIDSKTPLIKFVVTLQKIEKAAGLIFSGI